MRTYNYVNVNLHGSANGLGHAESACRFSQDGSKKAHLNSVHRCRARAYDMHHV